MSRKSQDDEYNENRKTVETFSDGEADYDRQENEKNECAIIDSGNWEQMCLLTKFLKEYASDNALPLCQYLSQELITEFTESE